jgi:hypothetical protein
MKNQSFLQLHVLLTSLMVLISFEVQAQQEPIATWVKSIGSESGEFMASMAVDDDRNSYVTGDFFNKLSVSSKWIDTTLVSNGHRDVFLIKYDKNGEALWASSFGGADLDNPNDLEMDSEGNLYISGYFTETIRYKHNATDTQLTNNGSYDVFVARFSNLGELEWISGFGGTSADVCGGVSLTGTGGVIICGSYNRSMLVPTEQGDVTLSSKGRSDIFIAELDSKGKVQWAKSIGGAGLDGAVDVKALPSGDFYVGGSFSDEVDFSAGADSLVYRSKEKNRNPVLLRFNRHGECRWIRPMDVFYDFSINEIATDSLDNLYGIGSYKGKLTLNHPPYPSMVAVLADDAFIIKLDSQGNYLWLKSLGGTKDDHGYGIDVNAEGHVAITGFFENSITIPQLNDTTLVSSDAADLFMAQLDQAGNWMWIQSNISKKIPSANDYAYVPRYNTQGNLWVLGKGADSTGFIEGSDALTIKTRGSSDGFLLYYNMCDNVDSLYIPVTACVSYDIPGTSRVIHESSWYIDTVFGPKGCYTIRHFDIEITKPNTTVLRDTNGLFAEAKGLKYQWGKCDSGWVNLTADTLDRFKPPTPGGYGVIVIDSTCSDTSTCVFIVDEFKIWPNPVTNLLRYSVPPGITGTIEITVYNAFGNDVPTQHDEKKKFVNMSALKSGLYFVHFRVGNKAYSQKVLKN